MVGGMSGAPTKHAYSICRTGDEGIHTGRPRWWVACVTCGEVLHENTTGPMENVEMHEREAKRRIGPSGPHGEVMY